MTPDCANAPEPQRHAVARTANPRTFLIDIPPGWTRSPFARRARRRRSPAFSGSPERRLILPGAGTVAGNRRSGKRNYYANRKKSAGGRRFVRIYREVLLGGARLPDPPALAMAVRSFIAGFGENHLRRNEAPLRRQEKWLT